MVGIANNVFASPSLVSPAASFTLKYDATPPGDSNNQNDFEKRMVDQGHFSDSQSFQLKWEAVGQNPLPEFSNYRFFRKGVSPLWEDPANARGGKWQVTVEKDQAHTVFGNIVSAILDGEFDCDFDICGVVLAVRTQKDIISLWNRSGPTINEDVVTRLGLCFELVTGVDDRRYLLHNWSLQNRDQVRATQVLGQTHKYSHNNDKLAGGTRQSNWAKSNSKSRYGQRKGVEQEGTNRLNNVPARDSKSKSSKKRSSNRPGSNNAKVVLSDRELRWNLPAEVQAPSSPNETTTAPTGKDQKQPRRRSRNDRRRAQRQRESLANKRNTSDSEDLSSCSSTSGTVSSPSSTTPSTSDCDNC